MRRTLLSALVACAVLAGAGDAPAAPQKAVDLTLRNATDQRVVLTYGISPRGDRAKRVVLDPDETARDLSDGASSVGVALDDCGPTTLRFENELAGKPVASIGGGNERRNLPLDEGEEGELRARGVRVTVARRGDSANTKVIDAAIVACHPPASDTMTPTPEESATWRNVRATVRNATGAPVDVVYRAVTDGPWRALTLPPGAVSPEFGHNMPGLVLGFADCGPTWMEIENPLLQTPRIKVYDETARDSGGGLDEGDDARLSVRGQSWIVTRQADSSNSKRFAIDIVACPR